MSTVDSKVVELKFDGKTFGSGVKDALSGLASLNAALSKQVATTALDGLGKTAESAAHHFSVLKITAVGALLEIGKKVTDTALGFAKSFTTAPIQDGFKNYETKLNAIQTILANTGLEGKAGLGQVTGVLADLNTYANQTVYNFADMTKNIGTFTAAGVKLQPAADAIKGIANLAALSGSSADQASGAMYQLSQAIAAGKVGLQDWNSVVNAGIGGKVFQNALFESGKALKTIKGVPMNQTFEQWTKAGNTFRGSLKSGWITGKVLTQTLAGFTGDLTDAQLKSQGYNATQIKQIQKIGKVAVESATKIKTITQLAQALKEEVGTAYATIFETLIGNIDQAKSLLSPLHTFIENGLTKPIYALNTILQNWANIGGRVLFLDAIKQAFNDILRVISPIRKAFEHIFPVKSSQQLTTALYGLTIRFDNFFKRLKMGPHMADNVRRIFQGLFAVLDIGKTVIQAVAHFIGDLFGAITKGEGAGGFLLIAAHVGDFLVHLDKTIKKGDAINKFFKKVEEFIQPAIDKFHDITSALAGFLDSGKSISSGVQSQLSPLSKVADFIHKAWVKVPEVFHNVVDAVKSFINRIKPIGAAVGAALGTAGHKIADFFGNIDYEHLAKILEKVGTVIGNVFTHIPGIISNVYGAIKAIISFITNTISKIPEVFNAIFGNISYDQILSTINTGLFGGLVLLLTKFFKRSEKIADGKKMSFLDKIAEPFHELTETLKQMQQNLKAAVLIEIAIAIGILAASCAVLAGINPVALTSALTAIGVMMGGLMGSLEVFTRIGGTTELAATSAGLVIFALAIRVLTSSVKALSELSWQELAKGLVGVGVLLAALAGTSKLMAKDAPGMIAGGTGLTIMAVGIRILVGAVKELGAQDYNTLKKGLISVGVLLGELGIFTHLQDADGGGVLAGAGLVLLAIGINQLAKSVAKFGKMDTGVLKKGLITLGLILAGLAAFSYASTGGLIAAAAGMLIISFAMKQLVKPIKQFAAMSWAEIGRGLTVMAGALGSIALAIGLLPEGVIFSAAAILVVAISLQKIGDAMKTFSGMSWEEIAKGMIVLAGSLTIISIAMDSMTLAIFGAAALIVVAGALAVIAPVLVTLGGLSWIAIAKGLVALAAAFAVIGLAAAALTPVIPSLLGLGAGILLIGGGIALVGVGVLAFATGLAALALAGTGAAAAIVAIGTALVSLVPLMIAGLVNAFDVLLKALIKAVPDLLKFLEQTLLGLISLIVKVTPPLVKAIITMANTMLTAFSQHAGDFATKMVTGLQGILDAIDKKAETLAAAGLSIIIHVLAGIKKKMPTLVASGIDVITSFIDGIGKNITSIIQTGTILIIKFIEGIANAGVQIVNAAFDAIILFANGIAQAIRDHNGEFLAAGGNIASAIASGLTLGMSDHLGGIWSAAKRLGGEAIKGIKSGVDSNSPSKEAMKVGQFVADGFIIGMRNGAPGVKAAFGEVSAQFKKMIQDSATDIKNYQDKIAAANPKTKAGAAAIRKYSAALKEANETHKSASNALQVLSNNFDKEHAHLLKLGREYDRYQAKLDKANDALKTAKDLRDQYIGSLKSEFNVQNTISPDTTVQSFTDAGDEQIADLEKFSAVLKALRKAGIDDTTYNALLGDGPAALPFMEELLASGKPAIDKIKAQDKTIAAQSASLAKTAYETVYGTAGAALYKAGVDSAQGLVDGLKKSQKKIADQMKDISLIIIKALKKALGIKSPSTVLAELGVFMGKGIVVGLDSTAKDIEMSSANLGNRAAESLRRSITGIMNNVVDSSTLNPTITPILDLTMVKRNAGQLGDMLSTGPIGIGDAYMKAISASASFQASRAAAATAQADISKSIPEQVNNYTQNNYSPKALSRVEIYRQTKNQISSAKGALAK